MKILWFTWKDKKHPLAGGAETINEAICERLVLAGHEVTLVVGSFLGAPKDEMVRGYRVIRLGSRYTVYIQAYLYYKKNLQGWADVVIDEVNTMPFFCKLYVREKNILFIHQLCREIWFYQMIFPFSLLGYIFEPVYLRLLKNQVVFTISQSTKSELIRFGFSAQKIHILSEGIEISPLEQLSESVDKFQPITLLSLGSLRPMKRTLHIVKAFEFVRARGYVIQLKITGDATSRYGKKVFKYCQSSAYKNEIIFLGRVTTEQKIELLRNSTLLCVTSLKEGWGLVVTEANSQGTPAVVYNVDGLRDSVQDSVTGWTCKSNTPQNLADQIVKAISDRNQYIQIRKSAYNWSVQITFEKSFQDFLYALESLKNV